MRVLYLSHTAHVSGGERSLLDVLSALPDPIEPAVACPEGPFANAVRELGVPVFRVAGTDSSLRLHPVHTVRGLAAMGVAAVTTQRIAARFGADVVHANSIRAGVIAALAHLLGGPRAAVYVRDCLPPGLVSTVSLELMGSGVGAVLANSRYTALTVPDRFRGQLRVVHSPLDVRRFDPLRCSRDLARRSLGIAESDIVLVLVAQLTPWKGQDDAIRVLARLHRSRRDVHLLLVGSAKFLSQATRYDNDSYRAWLGKLAGALEVQSNVRFLGERDDVPSLLAAADIALLPSWEEPFGRSVVEAMAMECAVVATNVGGPSEILDDGMDGILLPPRRPRLWADVVEGLIADHERRARMAKAARSRAKAKFRVERHVETLLETYSELTSDL